MSRAQTRKSAIHGGKSCSILPKFHRFLLDAAAEKRERLMLRKCMSRLQGLLTLSQPAVRVAGDGRRLDLTLMRLAIFRGRGSNRRSERRGKMALVDKSKHACHLAQWQLRIAQQLLCSLNADPRHVLMRARSGRPAKGSSKVVLRHAYGSLRYRPSATSNGGSQGHSPSPFPAWVLAAACRVEQLHRRCWSSAAAHGCRSRGRSRLFQGPRLDHPNASDLEELAEARAAFVSVEGGIR